MLEISISTSGFPVLSLWSITGGNVMTWKHRQYVGVGGGGAHIPQISVPMVGHRAGVQMKP